MEIGKTDSGEAYGQCECMHKSHQPNGRWTEGHPHTVRAMMIGLMEDGRCATCVEVPAYHKSGKWQRTAVPATPHDGGA